ncbi:MAG TPA: ABC transporter permease [Propionibacteriaceae bacterium]|nr:ABC transporter permease [Propionibacteriaceae bacterium]
MARFLLRRTLHGVFVLFLISVLVFALFFLAPGDVARRMAGRQATPEMVELVRRRLGLDRPLLEQYGSFVWRALHGDLGFDYYHEIPVSSIIVEALPKTLSLVLGAALLWMALGILNGVVSAVRSRSVADRALTGFSLLFYSMPEFLLGLLLLYFAYYRLTVAGLAWFPAGGYVPLTQDPLEWARSLILPWLTLALLQAASYTRLTRSSLLEVLGEDYIRTARSKGLSERRVVYRHGLRSAITPVLTQFGIDLGALIGGDVVVEQVFSIDGLGREAITALGTQNLPVIVGIVLFGTLAIVVANIAVDLLYAVLDPRIRVR